MYSSSSITHFYNLEDACEALFASLSESSAEETVVEYLKAANEIHGDRSRIQGTLANHNPLASPSCCCGCSFRVILKTGLRFCDIRLVGSVQLTWSDKVVKMEVRTAKNRKRRADRLIVRVPTTWFGTLSKETEEYLLTHGPSPFEHLSTNIVLRTIHIVHGSILVSSVYVP